MPEDSSLRTLSIRNAAALIAALGLMAWPKYCSSQVVATYPTTELDPYAAVPVASDPFVTPVGNTTASSAGGHWCLDLFPEGLIYRPYLAGPKESRTGIQFYSTDDDWQFDSSIGGQWGLLRFGTQDRSFPAGWQLDFEASAQFRFSDFASQNVLTNDIRFGLPLSFSRSNHKTKLAFYFLRSNPSDRLWDVIDNVHNDEFFERRALAIGHSIYLSDRFRIYGEAEYAFSSRVSDQWAFQFGAEYAPVRPTGLLGAPFLAANAYLREEVDYGGLFNLQAGWGWRKRSGRLFRVGLHYANGKSNHFALHDLHEQQIGFGLWHDF